MDKVEAFMSRMRGKDWNPLFDRIHIGTVRVMMGATVISGIYTVYAMFKWKQEVDFRTEIENFRIEEDARRSNVEEGTREELKDIATDQKDPAKRYKFS